MPDFDDLPLPPDLATDDNSDDTWADELATRIVGWDGDPVDDADHLARTPEDFTPGTTPDPVVDRARGWTIDDEGAAEWALRHVTAAEQDLERLAAQAARWTERIDQWFSHRARPLQAKAAFFSAHLEAFALRRRREDPKAKTLVLPSGVVKTVAAASRVEIVDSGEVLGWAKIHAPDLVTKVEKVQVSDLRGGVRIVERIVRARLVLDSGVIVDWLAADAGALRSASQCPMEGDAVVGGTVARVEVVETAVRAVGSDGWEVPGVRVTDPTVHATVQAAP